MNEETRINQEKGRNGKKCSHGMCGRNSGSEWCRARACRDSGCHENPVQEKPKGALEAPPKQNHVWSSIPPKEPLPTKKCGVRVMLEKGLHFDCILPSGHRGLHDAIFPDDAEWKMSKVSIDTEKPPHCTCGPTSVAHVRGCYEGWGTVTTDHFVDVNKMVPDDAGGWSERLMDEFCVMFERAARDKDETDWVEKMESFIARLLEQEREKAFSIHGQISQAALWFDRGAQAEHSRIEEAVGKLRKMGIVGIKNGEYMTIKDAEIGEFNAALDAVLKVIREPGDN